MSFEFHINGNQTTFFILFVLRSCTFGFADYRKGTGMLLVPGMVFTIEPMINMGTWQVFIDEEDGWTVVTEDELPSAQWEHTFLMTETGLEILSY